MIIRNATPNDAESIAQHIMLAMEDIVYSYIGQPNRPKAKDFLLHFIKQRNNQYSYENCLVAEDADQVMASLIFYDGAKLKELRQPVIDYVSKHFNRNLHIEDETQAGEVYIDCLGVSANDQGKGVGAGLLHFLIDEEVIKKKHTLGLLVDNHHPNAKKLYLKTGFKSVGVKMLLGNVFEHLQIKPNV